MAKKIYSAAAHAHADGLAALLRDAGATLVASDESMVVAHTDTVYIRLRVNKYETEFARRTEDGQWDGREIHTVEDLPYDEATTAAVIAKAEAWAASPINLDA